MQRTRRSLGFSCFFLLDFLILVLKLKPMKETLYTLHYTRTLGGGDTEEPEENTEHTLKDLTKEKLDSWLYTLREGDFGCSFGNFKTEEQ